MSRIGSLGSDQLSALRRIYELSHAITQNTTRLSTLRRINSAKDDPAGLIRSTLLETELTAAEQASKSVTRANAVLNTAAAAAGEIVTQLQSARTLALDAASGTLSDADIAANQVQIDTILSSINSLTQTSFAGKRLLDGNASVRTTSVDNTKIIDVDVLTKQSTSDVSVSIDLTTQATQGTSTYTSGTLGADATVTVTGEAGTTTISLSNGADVTVIAQAFEDVKHLTGISAVVDGADVDFTNVDYGTKTTQSFEVTAGGFSVTGVTGITDGIDGIDAIATINGQSVTGDGATFRLNTSDITAIIEIDPTISTGEINAFNVTGNGL
jgi:flagellin